MADKDDDARRFFDPKVIARIGRLDLRAQKVVEGFIAGMHRSPFFGHSVEFAQHRDYVRGMILLFSDLLTDRDPLLKGLEMLRARKHDVMVFHIMDDDELTFPFAGTTRFEGMEELPNLLCDPKALREGYLEALEEYLIEVRRGCTRLGIDYNLVRTGDYLDAILSKFLHNRMDDRSTASRNAGPMG